MKKDANKINKEWHQANRMPPNAKLEQRIEWHIEHTMNCACRAMPAKIQNEIKRRKIKLK